MNKAKELDSKISEIERRKRIKEIKEEIKFNNTYIEMLGKENISVRNSYELKILNLEKECMAIEETLNYKSYKEIQNEVYLLAYNSIIDLYNKVFDKVEYLERVLGEKDEKEIEQENSCLIAS